MRIVKALVLSLPVVGMALGEMSAVLALSFGRLIGRVRGG